MRGREEQSCSPSSPTMGDNKSMPSATELNSHINMVVVGRQSSIISRSGVHAEVKAFSNDCGTLSQIPIVDVALEYDCPLTSKTFVLIVRNALYVESMEHNLMPPFVMREAGIVVNDVPPIHCGDNITNDSHCIIIKGDTSLRIPLRLRGIFSDFPTRSLTEQEIEQCDELASVYLTPEGKEWDPNDTMLDNEEAKSLGSHRQ